MKKINSTQPLFYFIILTFLTSLQVFAQTDRVKEALSKLDTTSFKGKAFLNKSLISKSLIESFRKKQKNASFESEITLVTGDLAELYKISLFLIVKINLCQRRFMEYLNVLDKKLRI